MDDRKLSALKEEYLNTQIPAELPFMVKKAIIEGKRISMLKNRRKQWIGAAAVIVCTFIAVLNISPAAAQALSDIPIIKNIVNVLTFREYRVNEGNYNANIKVPAVQGMHNQALETGLNAKYLEENKKLYQEFIRDIEELKARGFEGHMGVDSGYEVKTDNGQILSIGCWVVNTVGSSSTTVKYDTIDTKREILITLPSLFKDDSNVTVISENIRQQMLAQMEADKSKTYWVSGADDELFEGFETITPEQNFYIRNDGKLVISFDKYEVAPGYMGVVEFIIPTEVLSDILTSNEYIK